MPDHQAIKDFFSSTAGLERAYNMATVHYLAGRKTEDSQWALIQARIYLGDESSSVEQQRFQCRHIRAGIASLRDTGPQAIIDALLKGHCPIEDGMIEFGERDGGGYDPFALKSYPDPARNTRNCVGLRLTGAWINSVANINEVGWELLATDPPYENLYELAAAFRVGSIQQQNASVELWTLPVAHFTGECRIVGTQAYLALRLAEALDPSDVRIVCKLRKDTRSFATFAGSELTWRGESGARLTDVTIKVPLGSEILCSLRYSDIVQEFVILKDNSVNGNPRRIAYETIDPGLTKLKELLDSFRAAEQNDAAFENLVVRLLWLAGFDPVHLGQDKRIQRGADILVMPPGGDDVVLVECTTSVLKQDKRAKLLRRAHVAREALKASGRLDATVLGLMVTCLPMQHIQIDAAQAEQDGLAVFGYEDLLALYFESSQVPNATTRLSNIKQRLATAAMIRDNIQL